MGLVTPVTNITTSEIFSPVAQSTITPSSALSLAATKVSFVAQSSASGVNSLAPPVTCAVCDSCAGCAEPHATNPIAINQHLVMTAV